MLATTSCLYVCLVVGLAEELSLLCQIPAVVERERRGEGAVEKDYKAPPWWGVPPLPRRAVELSCCANRARARGIRCSPHSPPSCILPSRIFSVELLISYQLLRACFFFKSFLFSSILSRSLSSPPSPSSQFSLKKFKRLKTPSPRAPPPGPQLQAHASSPGNQVALRASPTTSLCKHPPPWCCSLPLSPLPSSRLWETLALRPRAQLPAAGVV